MTRREQMICGLLEGDTVMREILWEVVSDKKTKQTIGNIYDNPELLEGDNQ